jgi:TIR domain
MVAIERGEAAHATAAPSYDVFISYQWQDHDQVEPIAQALRQRGLNVFSIAGI